MCRRNTPVGNGNPERARQDPPTRRLRGDGGLQRRWQDHSLRGRPRGLALGRRDGRARRINRSAFFRASGRGFQQRRRHPSCGKHRLHGAAVGHDHRPAGESADPSCVGRLFGCAEPRRQIIRHRCVEWRRPALGSNDHAADRPHDGSSGACPLHGIQPRLQDHSHRVRRQQGSLVGYGDRFAARQTFAASRPGRGRGVQC